MERIKASVLLRGLAPDSMMLGEAEGSLVTTDSREVRPGCIFVAFPGERFDGHDFAAKALEEKQAAFSARYDSCKQQLTAMQLLNEGGGISLLMQADDLYELLTFWLVQNDLTEHNKQLLDELDAEAQALDTQRQQAEAAATQAEQAAQALQARQDELTQTQIQLEQALQQASTVLDSQQAAAEAQAAVTEEKRKAYEQATDALDAYLNAQSQTYQDPARNSSLDITSPLP